MAYQPEKDERIHELPGIQGDNETSITVGIYSYDKGPWKVRINRLKTLKDGTTVVGKLGGISRTEAFEVGRALSGIAQSETLWQGGK